MTATKTKEPTAKAASTAPKVDPSQARIEAIRAKRRERGPISQNGLDLKLSVPEEHKDDAWTYRWVNDKAMKIHSAQASDWDFVESEAVSGDARNSGVGTRIERIVNERTTQTAEKAFLMRKPKEFFEEDQAAKQGRIKQLEDGLQRGETPGSEGLKGPNAYIPSGGISIKSGK